MKHLLHILLIIVAGIIIGGFSVRFYCGREFGNQIVDSSYTKVVDDVTTLTMLKNKTYSELIDQKERELSDTLFGLSAVENLGSVSEKKMHYLNAAVRYRQKYPFLTGDTNIDQEVERFLEKVKGKG